MAALLLAAYLFLNGLKLAREHAPDLMLMDIVLPDMEGARGGEAAARRRGHASV